MHRHKAERRADLWGLIKGVALGLCIGALFAVPLSAAFFVWLF